MNYIIYFQPSRALSESSELLQRDINSYMARNNSHISIRAPLAQHGTITRFSLTDEKAEGDVVNSLDGVARAQTPFSAECGSLIVYEKDVVVVELISEQLKTLHQEVIRSLSHIVDKDPKNLQSRFRKDKERRAVFEEYGYAYTGVFYTPHLTLFYANPSFHIENPDEFKGRKFDVSLFDLAIGHDYLSKRGKKRRGWTPINRFKIGALEEALTVDQ